MTLKWKCFDQQHEQYCFFVFIDSKGRWLSRQSLFNCGWGTPVFEGNLGLNLEETKIECQTACDRDRQCLHANVWLKKESYQACFLYSESDKCTTSYMRPDFYVYLKGWEMIIISTISIKYNFWIKRIITIYRIYI